MFNNTLASYLYSFTTLKLHQLSDSIRDYVYKLSDDLRYYLTYMYTSIWFYVNLFAGSTLLISKVTFTIIRYFNVPRVAELIYAIFGIDMFPIVVNGILNSSWFINGLYIVIFGIVTFIYISLLSGLVYNLLIKLFVRYCEKYQEAKLENNLYITITALLFYLVFQGLFIVFHGAFIQGFISILQGTFRILLSPLNITIMKTYSYYLCLFIHILCIVYSAIFSKLSDILFDVRKKVIKKGEPMPEAFLLGNRVNDLVSDALLGVQLISVLLWPILWDIVQRSGLIFITSSLMTLFNIFSLVTTFAIFHKLVVFISDQIAKIMGSFSTRSYILANHLIWVLVIALISSVGVAIAQYGLISKALGWLGISTYTYANMEITLFLICFTLALVLIICSHILSAGITDISSRNIEHAYNNLKVYSMGTLLTTMASMVYITSFTANYNIYQVVLQTIKVITEARANLTQFGISPLLFAHNPLALVVYSFVLYSLFYGSIYDIRYALFDALGYMVEITNKKECPLLESLDIQGNTVKSFNKLLYLYAVLSMTGWYYFLSAITYQQLERMTLRYLSSILLYGGAFLYIILSTFNDNVLYLVDSSDIKIGHIMCSVNKTFLIAFLFLIGFANCNQPLMVFFSAESLTFIAASGVLISVMGSFFDNLKKYCKAHKGVSEILYVSLDILGDILKDILTPLLLGVLLWNCCSMICVSFIPF